MGLFDNITTTKQSTITICMFYRIYYKRLNIDVCPSHPHHVLCWHILIAYIIVHASPEFHEIIKSINFPVDLLLALDAVNPVLGF